MIHRDLKPAKVEVSEDGSVKILAFGVANRCSCDPLDSATVSQKESDEKGGV